MRMGGKAVVAVFFDAMMALAGFFFRVHMNNYQRKKLELVEQLMPHLFGNGVGGRKRDLRRKRYVHLGMQAVSKPASTDIRYFFDLRHMRGGMADFVNYVWIDAIEHP